MSLTRMLFLSPIMFNLYSEYLTRKLLKDLDTEQLIGTVKHADDLVPPRNEEPALLSMSDRVTEIGTCYGIEMNVEKTKVMRI